MVYIGELQFIYGFCAESRCLPLFEIITEGIPIPIVVDPDSLNPDLDPASIASECGSGSRVW